MTHIYISEETNNKIGEIKSKNPKFVPSNFFRKCIEEYHQKEFEEDLNIDYIQMRLKESIKERKKIKNEINRSKELLEKAKIKEEQKKKESKQLKENEKIKTDEFFKLTIKNINYYYKISSKDEIERLAKEFISIPKEERIILFDFMKNKGYEMKGGNQNENKIIEN